jgi:2-desacetyl-2-hydroxyethyl bacteriochlorophyllide A dehydrogenase
MSLKSNKVENKRIVFPKKNKVEIKHFQIEKIKTNQILIKTRNTLISPGTETAFLQALPNTSGKFPFYPGYSNAGLIINLGRKVSRFKVDDRVVSRKKHASSIIATESDLIKIPENLSYEKASFFAIGSIAMQGIRKAKIELGETIVVLGQGLIGNLALQLAKLSGGIPTVGVDLYDYRLNISKKCGADYTINPSKVDLKNTLNNITEGKGAHVVIEATGNPVTVSTAFELVRPYGRIILLGSVRGKSEVNFYSTVHKKGLTVIGAHESMRPYQESSYGLWTEKKESSLTLKLISKGLLNVEDLITNRESFLNAEKAYQKLIYSKHNTLGIILSW